MPRCVGGCVTYQISSCHQPNKKERKNHAKGDQANARIADDLGRDDEFERSLYYYAFGTNDKREGVGAFLEKRAPTWGVPGAQN
jgi:hypothetical protein